MRRMTTKEAVQTVLSEKGISRYRLAKLLGRKPIMADNWLKKNTHMSGETADRFFNIFNIEISDAYRPTDEQLAKFAERNKK